MDAHRHNLISECLVAMDTSAITPNREVSGTKQLYLIISLSLRASFVSSMLRVGPHFKAAHRFQGGQGGVCCWESLFTFKLIVYTSVDFLLIKVVFSSRIRCLIRQIARKTIVSCFLR